MGTKLENFQNWKFRHMSLYEELKKKFFCAANDEELEEVMAELFFFGEEEWDNFLHSDDGK